MAVTERATINHAGIIQADVWTLVYGDRVSNRSALQDPFSHASCLLCPYFRSVKPRPVPYFTTV